MFRIHKKILILLVSATFLVSCAVPAGEASPGSEEGKENELQWPRSISIPRGEIVIYQPQPETFEGNKLTARAAVALTVKEQPEPVFGAIWMEARVRTDRDNRTVDLEEVKITNAKFPDVEESKIAGFKETVARGILGWNLTLSLDQLLTGLELVEKARAASEDLKTDPPEIIFKTHPAVLITIDGEPRLQVVENSTLMRVINTPFFLVLDTERKTYYLQGDGQWFQSSDAKGPYEGTFVVPDGVKKLSESELAGAEQEPDSGEKRDRRPEIIVATGPAELIVSDGEPTYTPIEGTGLLYMSNTEIDVIMEISTQRRFVLLSGRWYAAASMSGPWTHVPPDQLPGDLARIPPGSPKEHLLASIPGTNEAREAVLEASIPQTAAIDRKATIQVAYDGDPRFENVEDTGMQYAVNTSSSVFRVGGKYYCCDEGVWYVGGAPLGPWIVCDSVPGVIYTIPPGNPHYNVRYVYVYDSTPTVVYVGYTPGYVGCYVYRGVVVFGTGYWYRPWYRRYYYPRVWTWGFGVRYNPWTGSWGFRVGVRGPGGGWVVVGRGPVHRGWYGPGGYRRVHHHTTVNINRNVNVNISRNNIYNRRENASRVADRSRVRPAGRAGTGQARPGDRAAATRGGIARDRSSGASPASREARPGQGSNNVFTDRNGNVYRRTERGWERREGKEWSGSPRAVSQGKDRQAATNRQPSATKRQTGSSASSRIGTTQNRMSSQTQTILNQQYQARSRGMERTSNFQRSYRPSGASGSRPPAPRGGGVRRR